MSIINNVSNVEINWGLISQIQIHTAPLSIISVGLIYRLLSQNDMKHIDNISEINQINHTPERMRQLSIRRNSLGIVLGLIIPFTSLFIYKFNSTMFIKTIELNSQPLETILTSFIPFLNKNTAPAKDKFNNNKKRFVKFLLLLVSILIVYIINTFNLYNHIYDFALANQDIIIRIFMVIYYIIIIYSIVFHTIALFILNNNINDIDLSFIKFKYLKKV